MKLPIKKRNGIWYVDFRYNGKRIRQSLKTGNKNEAKKKYLELLKKFEDDNSSPQEEIEEIRLVEAFNKFDDYLLIRSETQRTYDRYIRSIRFFMNYIIEKHGDIKLDRIIPRDFNEFQTKRLESLKAKTVNLDRIAINVFFKWALDNSFIKENPMARTRAIPEKEKKEKKFYSLKELKEIFSYHEHPEKWKNVKYKVRHQKTHQRLYPFWLAFYATGMRKGELENLEWDDVDFNMNVIHIRFKDDWKPKSSKERQIPITKDFSRAYKMRKALNESDRYVFSRFDGSKLNENYLLKRLKIILQNLGIEGCVHTFRHTYASQHIMNGTDTTTLAAYMGHSETLITELYTHLSDEHLQKQAANLPTLEDVMESK